MTRHLSIKCRLFLIIIKAPKMNIKAMMTIYYEHDMSNVTALFFISTSELKYNLKFVSNSIVNDF